MSDLDSTFVCGCRDNHESVADCPDPISSYMKRRRERDASAAIAMREADRDSAPLFGMLFGDQHDDDDTER